jgi:hypothetical protein
VDIESRVFLFLVLLESEWAASSSGRFNPMKILVRRLSLKSIIYKMTTKYPPFIDTPMIRHHIYKSPPLSYFLYQLNPSHSYRNSFKLNGILTSMMKGVFWDVTPRGSCENRRLGGIPSISS